MSYNYNPPLNYNDASNNHLSRFLENLKNVLPDSNYQRDLLNKGNFNNTLINGYQQGFALYDDPEKDKKLFIKIDYDPLSEEKVNFDEINEKVQENYHNRNAYEEGKQIVKGAVDKINSVSNDTENKLKNYADDLIDKIKNLFKIDGQALLKYGSFILLAFILYKKI